MDKTNANSSPTRRRLAFLGLFVTVLIFGANFSISRHAVLHGLTPHDVLALRFATAGLLLLPYFLKNGGFVSCGGVGWWRGSWLAITSGFPMSYLVLTGLTMAPAAHGATISPGMTTLIGIIGGVILFGVVLTRNLLIGIACVLTGLVCLAIAGSGSATANTLRGDLCFVAVGLLWGFFPLLVQYWKVDGLKAAAVVSILSAAYLPIYALSAFRGFDIAPWWVLLAHAFNQGALNVVIGLWLWGRSAHILGAATVGRFPPLIPVAGTLLAIPILGEIPGPLQLFGILLIVSGLFLAAWRKAPPATSSQRK